MDKGVKNPSESKTTLTDLVLPGETNALGNLFGGELLARMDRACSIAAQRHSQEIVVTSTVNHVTFTKAVPMGSVLTVEAKITRAFESSMEVIADVWIEVKESQEQIKVNEGIYTFVAVNQRGRPVQVPKIKPITTLEKERYKAALRRKQLSLVLSKKMKPQDATELRSLFE